MGGDDETRQRGGLLLWAACWVAAAASLTWNALHASRWPDPVALVLFGALLVVAESSAADLPTATVSPSFMVVMAAITAFHHEVILGAAITGVWGGLVLANLRERRFGLVAFNCAQYSLAATAAATSFRLLDRVAGLGVPIIGAAVAFAVVNVTLVMAHSVLRRGNPVRQVWADMHPALLNYFAFGLLGTLVGLLYDQLGPLALVLLVTPVAIARSVFSSYLAMREAHEATIKVLLRAIEAKDPYTARHTRRVAAFSGYIGEELGLSAGRLQHLRNAALVHDVGKLAVPKALLTKPGRLTAEEFAQVQRHVSVCVDILAEVDFLRPMTAAAAGHHARYDGHGYGTGQQSFDAAIVAVADAFDAMTSTRSYRQALPQQVAFAELQAKAGTQLHPDCVEALIAAVERRGEVYGAGHEIDLVAYETDPPVAGTGSAGLGDFVESPGSTPAGSP